MANQRLYPFWGNLTEALRTGLPQNEVKGGRPGALRGALRRSGAAEGVPRGDDRHQSRREHDDRARHFPGSDYKTFVDVGTAQGDLAAQVALANPHLRGDGIRSAGGGADLRGVRRARSASPIALTFSPGSFFTATAKSGRRDDGPHPARLGSADKEDADPKAFDALPPGGAFIVYESIIDDDRSKNAFGLMMSLNMLIETPGGFDYTGADCSGWMKEAGFSRRASSRWSARTRW